MSQARPAPPDSHAHAEPVAFPLLADPASYVACRLDLREDARMRAYWLSLFRNQFRSLLKEAMHDASARGFDTVQARGRADAALEDFYGYLDVITHDPGAFGRLDIHQICLARQRSLIHFGFDDPYLTTKTRETQSALQALPAVLEEIDALEGAERDTRVIKGVFAGNIFDLGAPETIDLFRTGRANFRSALSELSPRPWLIDDLDAWLERMADRNRPYRAAVLFVDNAGSDVVLGMIPLARELLIRGTHVILTANSKPALNDITHAELMSLVEHVGHLDAPIRQAREQGRLELVHSGNGSPLIDLGGVSPELADAVTRHGVDLVVLEGMGRAVESNLDAVFRCDALKLAMIKDRGVAEELGGEVYDLVLRFDRV